MRDAVMTDKEIIAFVETYARPTSARVESVILYEHPFTKGGLVIVFDDDEEDLIGLIADVYRHPLPHGLSLHCLRRDELFELSMPGIFTLSFRINEHPHLPFYVKHKSALLYGRDLRDEVVPFTDPRVLLDNHIEGCQTNLRTLGICRWLLRGQHLVLIEELDKQMRYLMGTALLTRGEWEVDMESLPGRFGAAFADRPLQATWHGYAELAGSGGEADEATGRRRAFEAVWLFESFLRRLKEVAL